MSVSEYNLMPILDKWYMANVDLWALAEVCTLSVWPLMSYLKKQTNQSLKNRKQVDIDYVDYFSLKIQTSKSWISYAQISLYFTFDRSWGRKLILNTKTIIYSQRNGAGIQMLQLVFFYLQTGQTSLSRSLSLTLACFPYICGLKATNDVIMIYHVTEKVSLFLP